MDMSEFLTEEHVILDLRVRDKAALLHEVAQRLAAAVPEVGASEIEAALLAREQLGSTGLGNGFALPHARLEGLGRFVGLFVRTAKPLGFDAIDGKPVQLIFVLLAPGDESNTHVAALAAISRRFRAPDTAAKLLKAERAAGAVAILTGD
jgi:PTS system nitrogen regulatory IIA component